MTIVATGSPYILSKTSNMSTCTHYSLTLRLLYLRFLRCCYCEGTRKSSAYQVTQRTEQLLGTMVKMGRMIGILEKPHVHMEAQELEEQLSQRLLQLGPFTNEAALALRGAVGRAIHSVQKPLVEIDAGRVTRDQISTGVARLCWTEYPGLSGFPSIKTPHHGDGTMAGSQL